MKRLWCRLAGHRYWRLAYYRETRQLMRRGRHLRFEHRIQCRRCDAMSQWIRHRDLEQWEAVHLR